MKITDFGVAIIENDSHLSKWIVEHRRLDTDGSAREMCRYIKKGDTVVDAGASLGDHTTVYLEAVGPEGRVLAFEPNPAAFECLKHNCPKAELWASGLGRKRQLGRIAFDGPDTVNMGTAFFVEEPDGPVSVMRLDFLELKKVSFIKLDIEGMELEALEGASETIDRCRPVIMAEINHGCLTRKGIKASQIIGFMEWKGYRMELRDPLCGLDQAQSDVVFIPR